MQNLDDELETTTQIAKRLLPKMAQWNVPLTPENYHVWFEYFTGSNQGLVAEINEVMGSGKSFTREVNRALYDKYSGKEQTEGLVEQVQKETQRMFNSIIEEILITNNSTSDYSDKLKEYSHKLNDAKQLSEIQHIAEGMMKDTNKMAESTRNLQESLEEARTHAESLRKQLDRTEREALIDPLTGLHNRKAFDRKIKELCSEYKKNGTLFSVLMLDIDFFKSFNDRYGHKTGDEVLQIVGSTLHDNLKGQDFPARYGGEEFIVLLPLTTLDNACTVAEQTRKRISEQRLKFVKTGERLGGITVSVGVSGVNSGDTVDSVVERADRALYSAKNSGRNNVKCETDLVAECP